MIISSVVVCSQIVQAPSPVLGILKNIPPMCYVPGTYEWIAALTSDSPLKWSSNEYFLPRLLSLPGSVHISFITYLPDTTMQLHTWTPNRWNFMCKTNNTKSATVPTCMSEGRIMYHRFLRSCWQLVVTGRVRVFSLGIQALRNYPHSCRRSHTHVHTEITKWIQWVGNLK